MNSIQGIIQDLSNDETAINGCTTPGEVIIALQGLVEQNNSLKEKLGEIEHIVKDYDGSFPTMVKQFIEIRKVLEQE